MLRAWWNSTKVPYLLCTLSLSLSLSLSTLRTDPQPLQQKTVPYLSTAIANVESGFHRSTIEVFKNALQSSRPNTLGVSWNDLKRRISTAPKQDWEAVFLAIEDAW